MLCIRHRLWQSGPIFLICSLVLAAGFILQFRMLYTIHLKNQRIAEYKTRMNDFYETMKSVERVANNTAIMFRKLQRVIANHKAPHRKLVHKKS